MRKRKAVGPEKNTGRKMPGLLKKYNWRCAWCNTEVVRAPSGINQSHYKPPPNMATVDHLYDRNDIRRYIDGGYTRVLACFKCNQERRTFGTLKEWFMVDIIDIRDLINV